MPTPRIGTPLYDTQKGEWVIFSGRVGRNNTITRNGIRELMEPPNRYVRQPTFQRKPSASRRATWEQKREESLATQRQRCVEKYGEEMARIADMFGVEDGLSYEWIAKNWRRDCKQRKEAA